jgi:hypothetical protein
LTNQSHYGKANKGSHFDLMRLASFPLINIKSYSLECRNKPDQNAVPYLNEDRANKTVLEKKKKNA